MPVFHVARAPKGAIYVGRPSRWGNPFPIRPVGSTDPVARARSIERYRTWLWEEIRSGRLDPAELAELAGKDLACYCAPLPCHAEVLEAAAEWAAGWVGIPDYAAPDHP
jgi:hypothetical protein